MSFEDAIATQMISKGNEKTYIDKILSKADVDDVRALMKKSPLNRSEILELMYWLAGNESKLVNYSEWDRYIILKFFVWIRDFIKVSERLFDYQDDLKRKESLCSCGGYRDEPDKRYIVCKCPEFNQVFRVSDRTRKLLSNNERLIEHNTKFLCDLYVNIARTSLSVKAFGFQSILNNKYELQYSAPIVQQQEKKAGWFG